MPHLRHPRKKYLARSPQLATTESVPTSKHGLTGADLVDPSDPAFGFICSAAMELIAFGLDPNDPDMAQRAIKKGREDYEHHQAKAERPRQPGALANRTKLGDTGIGQLVYYARIGNRVKIGYTRNLTGRMEGINPEELMATEPGDLVVERLRHDQFRELRTHGEWFKLEEPLVSHIEKLRVA